MQNLKMKYYYEPSLLEDEYVLYNFISKLNHVDDRLCEL